MTSAIAHRDVNAAATDGVYNSQPEGIGRVVALDDLVCWNNLGRNVVFADRRLRPRAVFGSTLFPDEDEPSQYDLDVHSILDVPELGLVVVLNHLGTLRGFRRADILGRTGGPALEPTVLWCFVADVERTVAVDSRLVGSAPRSDGARGLLVSAPLDTVRDGASVPTTLSATGLGEVTALATVPSKDRPLIAVGGNPTVALVPIVGGGVGRPRWEADVGFRVASIAWHDGAIWAAGPDCEQSVDDYDWDRLGGGGFATLDPIDGRTISSGPLPGDVAWGTGGVAVAPWGRRLAAAGRTGSLHLINPSGDKPYRSSIPFADTSLGIAHVAPVARRLLCGFNRGGYRLHAFSQPSANAARP